MLYLSRILNRWRAFDTYLDKQCYRISICLYCCHRAPLRTSWHLFKAWPWSRYCPARNYRAPALWWRLSKWSGLFKRMKSLVHQGTVWNNIINDDLEYVACKEKQNQNNKSKTICHSPTIYNKHQIQIKEIYGLLFIYRKTHDPLSFLLHCTETQGKKRYLHSSECYHRVRKFVNWNEVYGSLYLTVSWTLVYSWTGAHLATLSPLPYSLSPTNGQGLLPYL